MKKQNKNLIIIISVVVIVITWLLMATIFSKERILKRQLDNLSVQLQQVELQIEYDKAQLSKWSNQFKLHNQKKDWIKNQIQSIKEQLKEIQEGEIFNF